MTSSITRTTSGASQALWVGRYLGASYFYVLLWALGIGIAVNLIVRNIPMVFEFVVGDKTIVGDSAFLAPPVAAVAITAFVIAIVNSGYSRILIGQGATRLNVARGNMLAALGGWAFIAAVFAFSALIEVIFPSFRSVEAQLGISLTWLNYLWAGGAVALALVFGSLIAAVFQRWHWIVGVIGLVLVLVVLPNVLAALPRSLEIIMWPVTPWGVAVIIGLIFTWVLRGVDVD